MSYQWICRKPKPHAVSHECPCGYLLGSHYCDSFEYYGKLVECPRCGQKSSFDITTEKRAELLEKKVKFIKLMKQIETECEEFCLYL